MDWRYNTIWFDQIKEEDQVRWDFDRKMDGPINLTDQRRLMNAMSDAYKNQHRSYQI